MDEIQPYEIESLKEMCQWTEKHSYEQTRLLMYATCPPKHKTKLEDYYPLITDEHEEVVKLEGEALQEARRRIKSAFKIN